MPKKTFPLQIGSLLFKKKSIGFITFGFFLMGLLTGVLSITYIENPNISAAYLPLFLFTTIIPITIISKGFRKATDADYN